MTQYDFDKLMEKYLRGECNAEEERLLDDWAARQLLQHPAPSQEEVPQLAKKQVWKRIQQKTNPQSPILQWLSWSKLGIAATIILAISAALWWQKSRLNSNQAFLQHRQGVHMSNTTNTPQDITLNDGSVVTLQPQSSITFPEKFGDHDRKVYLCGEAFFKVARMEKKPFYVFAGNLVTKVLGTSFRVKSYEQDTKAEVIVLSGKVKVYEQGRREAAEVLIPNQKIIYNKTTQQLDATVADQPVVLHPNSSPSNFLFSETPLLEVLEKMEKIYGLEISADINLTNCTFSGDLNDLDLYLQLDLICKSINAQVEKRETSLLLRGAGCN